MLVQSLNRIAEGAQIRIPGGTPGNSWWGCAARFSKSLPDFGPKKYNFPHPFSDQTSKIHTCFQTWPLGTNYVIVSKKFFKFISNSHSFLSFLLIWNWNDKYVHRLRSSLKNHTRFQTKMAKVSARFQTKTAQQPYPLRRGHIPI